MAAGDLVTIQTPGGKPSAPLFVVEVDYEALAYVNPGGIPVDLTDYIPTGATIVGVLVEDYENTGLIARYDKVAETLVCFGSNGAAPAALAELPNASALTTNKHFRLNVICY